MTPPDGDTPPTDRASADPTGPEATHHRIAVEVADPLAAELAADRLWQLGTLGIEERPGLLVAVFDDESTARAAAAEFGAPTPEPLDAIAAVDAARWRARPVRVGPVLIRPPWVDPSSLPVGAADDADPTPALELVIDPGRAFGSGSHPSTRLAVALLHPVVGPGRRVLDIGSGTGVLSVLAGLCGSTVTACDIDPPAVETTRDNVRRNQLTGRVAVTDRSVADLTGPYDVIVANVTIDIHERLAAEIDRLAAPAGVVVASGILEGRQLDRLLAAHPGRVLVEHRREGEWAGVVLGPPTAAPTLERVAGRT